jgi:hypothetical protein
MVLVSNDVYRLESMSGFGTRARIDDGVLGVVTVAVDRARDLPALISAEATGRIRRFSGYRGPRPSWSWLGQPPVDVSVDGEALQLAPPLRFRSLAGALRVRTPLDAPGASPAALHPAGPWGRPKHSSVSWAAVRDSEPARRTTPARLTAHVSTRPSRAARRRHRTPGTSRTITQAR